jgi:hypothetical protein
LHGHSQGGVHSAKRNQSQINNGARDPEIAMHGPIVKVWLERAAQLLDLPALALTQTPRQDAGGRDGLGELHRHGVHMHDDDFATLILTMPAMQVMRWKNPKRIRAQRKFDIILEQDSAPAADDGVEFPVQPCVLWNWLSVEMPNAAGKVPDHRLNGE